MEMYGERLRIRRKRKGLSQEALSELAGCTARTICTHEQMDNQPNTKISRRIEAVLGEF